jgi:hypothetical protein
MMIYVLYLAVVIVAFLVVLNGFLKGAKKVQIDITLSSLLIGIVIAFFIFAGWKHCLLAIVIAFFSAVVTRPIAARIASKIFRTSSGGGSGGYVGLPPRPLQRISQDLGKTFNPGELDDGYDRRAKAKEELLNYCEQQPSIQALLTEFNVSRKNLEELYYQLIKVGAGQWTCGHWVPASALAYPASLRYLLNQRGKNIEEAAFRVIMHFEQGLELET